MGRRVALRSAAALLLAVVVAGCICGVEADRLSKFQRKSSDPFTAVPERPAIQGGETADQKAQAEPLLDDNDGKTFKTVPTWSSCNVTGKCLRCTSEEMLKDQASCKKTKYHVQITCVDPGENPTDREAPRQTFIMHESCTVATSLGLGYFMVVMLLILAFSSPVVVVRRRRAR